MHPPHPPSSSRPRRDEASQSICTSLREASNAQKSLTLRRYLREICLPSRHMVLFLDITNHLPRKHHLRRQRGHRNVLALGISDISRDSKILEALMPQKGSDASLDPLCPRFRPHKNTVIQKVIMNYKLWKNFYF